VSASRILLADRYRLPLAGLRRLVEEIDGIEVIGETVSGREAVTLAKGERPDLVVMDVAMRELNGIDAAARIVQEVPSCRVLILSGQASPCAIRAALRSGALGIVLKDSTPEDLQRAIRAVLQGRMHLSHALSRLVINHQASDEMYDRLSARQREVLQLIAEGRTTREISGELHVSVKTVETHRAAIMARLGVDHIAGLVAYAIRENLLDGRC
jgi:DNA-binding NarL/FixJ family response regulator